MAFEEQIIEFLRSLFPPQLITIIIAMLPFIELRGALPVAYFGFHLTLAEAFFYSVIGNIIPVPIILVFFERVEKWLRKRYKWWDRAFTKLFARTRRKAKGNVQRWGDLALAIFVGIPLPVTGAWTGSLIAYLFRMNKWRATYIIFVGVWMAGVIVAAVCVFARWLTWLL